VSSSIRDKYHHGDLRSAVISKSNAHLRQHGDASLSLRAIARELDVDAAAVYRHFKSKSAIFSEVHSIALRELYNEMVSAQAKAKKGDTQ